MPAAKRKRVSLGGGAAAPNLMEATPQRLGQLSREGGAPESRNGVRRLADPFDLLRARGQLDREDAARNDLLWQAGERFRRHWHAGGLDGIKGFDPTRTAVDGTGGPDTATPTETALKHRQLVRLATEAVGPRLLVYLAGVVIEGRTLASLAQQVTDTAHHRTAEALAQERLREALHRL